MPGRSRASAIKTKHVALLHPPLYRIPAAMRILVTGAAGYIGSALVRALAPHRNEAVIATDQSSMPFANAITGNIAYPQFARSLKIGRASCRERVEMSV